MPDVMSPADHAPVRITLLSRRTRLLLRGDPAALGAALGVTLPTTPCTARRGESSALWLGPDEWLLLAADATAPPLWESESGAIFDISDRQVGMLVEGERSVDVLAAFCPLDLAAFAVGTCTRTVLGKAEIVLWRRDVTSFHLETGRSVASYVQKLLTLPCSSLAEVGPEDVAPSSPM
jgi:sarcosine oxidase subunit gamma